MKEIGELGLIRELARSFPPRNLSVLKGIGDDCAVVADGDRALLLTTDLMVEGVHFFSQTDPVRLARKLLAVNLSDIAAMGGRAWGALLSVALPPETPAVFWQKLASALADEFTARNLDLLGGDTSSSPGPIMLNLVLLGSAAPDKVIYRSGAGIGDLVFVSRPLGDSAAGLALLKNSEARLDPVTAQRLIAAHEEPAPEDELGPRLAESGLVTAMIDVSDGLATDLAHLAEADGLGAEVFIESVPISREARTLAGLAGSDPADWALFGGEDYALLFTAPENKERELRAMVSESLNRELWVIGRMKKDPGLTAVKNNESTPLSRRGYEHFRINGD